MTLPEIAEHLNKGGTHSESVRELFRRFGFERRGYHKVRQVRQELDRIGLQTEPDFEAVWIDASINFTLAEQLLEGQSPNDQTDINAEAETEDLTVIVAASVAFVDPTYRVKRLEAANQTLVAVSPNDDIARATTLMMTHDFSQLPVMSGERNLRGIITWKSLGMKLALGAKPGIVQDAMEDPVVVNEDDSLFAVIPTVIEKDYVLVRRRDQTYGGIITTADISSKFRELSEPFLVLGEIENYLRILLNGRFTQEELQGARDPGDDARNVESAADLTLGEIIRLLENPDSWEKLLIKLDRKEIVKRLDQVRTIRNDVMHFDPEGIGPADVEALRAFARFLRELRRTTEG